MQPGDDRSDGREKVGFGIDDEQQAGERGNAAGRHGFDADVAAKRPGHGLDQPGGDQQSADHVR